jgi:hypothetical protein
VEEGELSEEEGCSLKTRKIFVLAQKSGTQRNPLLPPRVRLNGVSGGRRRGAPVDRPQLSFVLRYKREEGEDVGREKSLTGPDSSFFMPEPEPA